MMRRKVHVLYEYGPDLRPHGSAYIRLLRPLSHPLLNGSLEVTSGLNYEGERVDAVIVDRFWRPDNKLSVTENLIKRIRLVGAKLIYALDDNFMDLPDIQSDSSGKERLAIVQTLLFQADSLWVTTAPLKERYASFNTNIQVIPNALDERLLIPRIKGKEASYFDPKRKTIGFMGTFTHDEDILMILPALEEVCRKHPDQIEFQVVGAVKKKETIDLLRRLPLRILSPKAGEMEYPLFLLWFCGQVNWDIAISPLKDTSFNSCKSDIKFLDYCALGAAGVYSRVTAYQSSVNHQNTGWFAGDQVEDWVDGLESLIVDDELRESMARSALRYLYSKRILAQCTQNWLEAFEAL